VDKKPTADTAVAKPAATPVTAPAATSDASASKPPASSAAPAPTSAKVWENYFVPGGKILFFTDFSEDKVGNFAPVAAVAQAPNRLD